MRKHLAAVIHDLGCQKESNILEGHLQSDHARMLISKPSTYLMAQVVGYIKGKSAVHTALRYLGRRM